jgi:hypothetical protein
VSKDKKLAELAYTYAKAQDDYDTHQTNGIRDAKWGERLLAASIALRLYLRDHYGYNY